MISSFFSLIIKQYLVIDGYKAAQLFIDGKTIVLGLFNIWICMVYRLQKMPYLENPRSQGKYHWFTAADG